MSIVTCTGDYYQEISGCIPQITILGVDNNTDYVVKITLANGSLIQFKKKSELFADELILEQNELLNGFWNDATGEVKIEIYDFATMELKFIEICDVEYSQIIINFLPIETNLTNINIPLNCN